MLVAIARIPDGTDARARAAQAAGLPLADLNRRLAGILPRVLFAGGAPDGVVEALQQLGFGLLTCEPAEIPDDDQRVVVRRIELAPGALVAADSKGQAHRCAAGDIALLQRGM